MAVSKSWFLLASRIFCCAATNPSLCSDSATPSTSFFMCLVLTLDIDAARTLLKFLEKPFWAVAWGVDVVEAVRMLKRLSHTLCAWSSI